VSCTRAQLARDGGFIVAQTNLESIVNQPWLDAAGKPLSEGVRAVFSSAGERGRGAKNALHGVWLGHPLHPVLTDVPIGAWTTAIALDAREVATGDRGYGRAADFAIGLGLVGAVGAAVTGLTDWSETEGRSRRLGLIHGLLNITATAFVATSYALRKQGSRSGGRATAIAGYGIALASAYLGGSLVYHERIGVTHAAVAEPEEFTPVLDSAALPDNSMRKATIEDASFVVVRQRERVCALAHSCSHLGGPLSEGTLKEGSVVCPWHGSEFALDDGRVLNGPATEPQPCFEVREQNGKIELRGQAN
jgi:nitrite reductase/ring-hydroxylating ferredoxin subunit